MTSAPVISFGQTASIYEVDIGLDNEGTFHTWPDAPPKPSFMHTEQRSALWKVQSETSASVELLVAALDGKIDLTAPPLGIDAKLYPIRFLS